MNTIVVLRHAEAVSAADDFERPLSAAGRLAAQRVGRELLVQGPKFQLILASAALRTHQTAELVLAELGYSVRVELRRELYEAAPAEYFAALRRVPAAVTGLLLIGHNPTLSEVARQLVHKPVALAPAERVKASVAAWAELP